MLCLNGKCELLILRLINEDKYWSVLMIYEDILGVLEESDDH